MAYPRFDPRYQQQPYFDPRATQGGMDPAAMQWLMSILFAGQEDQPEEVVAQSTEEVVNPYLGSTFRPTPRGLSPIDRYHDMGLRRQAQLADGMTEGREAVALLQAQQAQQAAEQRNLVDQGLVNFGKYGSGSSTTGPSGMGSGFDGVEGGYEDWLAKQHHDKWNPAAKVIDKFANTPEMAQKVDSIVKQLGLRRK